MDVSLRLIFSIHIIYIMLILGTRVPIDIGNAIRFFLAMILAYGANIVPKCDISKKAGNILKFRPPPYVFGIAWPILYTLLGFSWVYACAYVNQHAGTHPTIGHSKSLHIDITYAMIGLTLSAWIITYSCMKNKKGGVYAILLGILLTLWAIIMSPYASKMTMAPLLVWLGFALLMNVFEVQFTPSKPM